MNKRPLLTLAGAALVVAIGAIWVSIASRPERSTQADQRVLPSLAESLDSVSEVRLSRADGAATTLQRRDGGWFVAQRNYRADTAKLRALLIELAGLRVVEQKTSDPAHYATLGVEDENAVQSHSVRIDIVAGAHTWSLLLGKQAQPDGNYVRVSSSSAALWAQPRVEADPQPARWIQARVLDIPADQVQHVAIHPLSSPAYWLAREPRGAPDFTLHGVPPGRKAGSNALIDAVGGVLARLNVEDVKERAPGSLEKASQASFRTFDGLQIALDGTRDQSSAWIRIHAGVDVDTAKQFALGQKSAASESKSGANASANKAAGSAPGASLASEAGTQKPDPAAQAAAINSRAQAYEFQIPVYQYDQIFRPVSDLLAPLAQKTVGPAGSKVK